MMILVRYDVDDDDGVSLGDLGTLLAVCTTLVGHLPLPSNLRKELPTE